MPLNIIRNDITKMQVNAIVNAANTDLLAGGGVCGAIFDAAGADRLQKACDELAPIKTGEAVLTKGFGLLAKFIIHTAGPVYQGGDNNEEELLRSCYISSLDLAKEHRCESIAFPLISSGIYGYPKDEAITVATSAIGEWLMKNDMDVSLVVFDKAAFAVSNDLLGEVKAYVDENYVDDSNQRYSRDRTLLHDASESYTFQVAEFSIGIFEDIAASIVTEPSADEAAADAQIQQAPAAPVAMPSAALPKLKRKGRLDDVVGRLDEPFSDTLLRLIDTKGRTDVEIYKRANLDRKLFSKIRTGKGYMPSKKTAVALAVALELSLTETSDLLERAGFALSRSVVFDVIIEYFITKKRYDIFEINNVLFEYDQQLLGG